jgi:hypothetical protein
VFGCSVLEHQAGFFLVALLDVKRPWGMGEKLITPLVRHDVRECDGLGDREPARRAFGPSTDDPTAAQQPVTVRARFRPVNNFGTLDRRSRSTATVGQLQLGNTNRIAANVSPSRAHP